MHIIYVIGGVNPEYQGWLQIKAMPINDVSDHPNGDELRSLVINHVNRYMLLAGQKYHLYWVAETKLKLEDLYQNLKKTKVPRYGNSGWFNTDVWTVRRILHNPHRRVTNYRRLKPLNLAKYLDDKYQKELHQILRRPHNDKEQRFKRDFFNAWQLSSVDTDQIQRVIRMFAAFLLLRNLVNTVPKGCRKMYRKLIPLRMDDLTYDLKLLDYKFKLTKLIQFKEQINSLRGKPFGTAEFTNPYLEQHVKFLQIFNQSFLKQNFNL